MLRPGWGKNNNLIATICEYNPFQIYIAVGAQAYQDKISISEIYKIDHTDPDEPIQIRPLAELFSAGDTLVFLAQKWRQKRRSNFLGKTLKTALMQNQVDGNCSQIISFVMERYTFHSSIS